MSIVFRIRESCRMRVSQVSRAQAAERYLSSSRVSNFFGFFGQQLQICTCACKLGALDFRWDGGSLDILRARAAAAWGSDGVRRWVCGNGS